MAASSSANPLIACEHAKFAHAVNSRVQFEQAAKSESINFIETDIILSQHTPVLGHDPGQCHDMTLEQLLSYWSTEEIDRQVPALGLKLDFKQGSALRSALAENSLISVEAPAMQIGEAACSALLVNADILPADISCSFFDAPLSTSASQAQHEQHTRQTVEIFTEVLQQRPDVLLSLSWSTGSEYGVYSESLCTRMLEVVAAIRDSLKSHVPITYPVRATWVRKSWVHLEKLVSDDPAACFTVWSNVPPAAEDIEWMKSTLPQQRTMYDLPPAHKS